MDYTADFYSRPSNEFRGGGFPVFSGSRRQRGGGFFGSLKNFFLPIAKKLGRSLFTQGVGLANDVAFDTMEGKNIKESLKERGKARAVKFGKSAAREGMSALSNMIGKGSRRVSTRRKRLRRRKSKPARRHTRRRAISRKATSRKRRSRTKSTHRSKAKRRRTNF